MANILVLEKAAAVRRAFSMTLAREGHCVFEAASMQDFIPQIAHADIAMIDVDMPDGEGYRAVLHLQHVRPQAGVILLSECGNTDDKIRSLHQFADQYLTKPIQPEMLSAHMAPMVRRFSAGSWRLDGMKRELVSPSGHREALNHQEMHLLELLSKKPHTTVSRRDIVTALGHNWLDYDERRLDQLISRLRRRWRKNSRAELPLHTDRGLGYRLSAVMHRP
ncbi:response regulator transcription factor [Herbaspirillum chlorophenolicum]|jgi:DNA-binding response OmpR family regulator|uniref:Response regulator transcription factor n=1 Tax=Herbaspirillum chlorophenolicum TaxID=211589 RepID=A0ABW8EVY7_9BURK|nr:response regulator transcription factor [Herbaspirillum chlorophenolicum]